MNGAVWEWALHGFILAGLAGVLMNLVLNLAVYARPPRVDAEIGAGMGGGPSVSVLIPARDEAGRIGPCIESLAPQAGAGVEVIVLDDHSGDDTAAVVRSFGFVDEPEPGGAAPAHGPAPARLRLLRGEPLPEGWTGKNWACHQLAAAARGEWLVFTDADTVYQPGAIAALVAHARERRAALLSAWPRQVMGSWSEKMVIPLIGLLILGFLPQWFLAVLQRFPGLARGLGPDACASLGTANGQCMVFRAELYRRVGGHRAVRDHLVEDVALARRVARETAGGLRLWNCDGGEWVRCRMYENFRGVWEGFTKNLRPAFEGNPAAFVASLVLQFTWMILPFAWCVARPSVAGWVGCGMVWLIRLILLARLGGPVWPAVLHPVSHLLALAIALNSWRACVTGGVTWKGRGYLGSARRRR